MQHSGGTIVSREIKKYSQLPTINRRQQQRHHVHRCRVNSSIIAVAVALQHAMATGKTLLEGNNQLVASQQFFSNTIIAATANKQITISGRWQQSCGASGSGFCTSCCVAVSNRSILWCSGEMAIKKWQCLQGWFVSNGSGEFGLLHHLNFSKGHYDMLADV